MPSERLIELRPGKGLDSGLYPSAEAAAGAIWRTGLNMWFRPLGVHHAPGRQFITKVIGRQPQAAAQAFTQAGVRRLYFEDLGVVNYWEGANPFQIGAISSAGSPDFETWGDWLLATDNVGNIQIWKNAGALATIADAATQFARAKLLRRMAQHVLAISTNVLPTGFHWCSADNPEVWTPSATNSARNLNVRNLDSEIVAAEPLGAGLALYSKETMILVRYVGPTQWFGTPTQALSGIGAVSRKAIVPFGNFNFGLSRAGIFKTDGSSFQYIDRPAFDIWLQENVNWALADSVASYYDEVLNMAVWSVPLMDGTRTAVAVDPKLNSSSVLTRDPERLTYLDGNFGIGLERQIFDFPIIGKEDGMYYTSKSGTLMGNFTLTSHLMDAGAPDIFKSWDYAIMTGNISNANQVRFGFVDEPNVSAIEWTPWQLITTQGTAFGPRESVYLAIDIKGTQEFRMSSLTVMGEKAGQVN